MFEEQIIKLDFAEIHFRRCLMIVKIAEGTVLDKHHLEELGYVAKRHFNDKPFVYISDRKADYNVYPTAYITFPFPDNLQAIVIVTQGGGRSNAEFEKKFIEKPFKIVSELDEAITWGEQYCSSSK